MNINKNIDNLLFALSQKGQIYKINSFQFFSEKNKRYCNKYQISKKESIEIFNIETNDTEIKEKYTQKKECYNKIDVMKYLIKEYKDMKEEGEANGI